MASEKYVTAQLPRDLDNCPIQALAPGTPTNAALSGSSTDTTLPAGAEIIEVGVDQDAWILFSNGGTTVSSSNGQFLPAGVAVYRVPVNADTITHIQNDTSGRISITPLT